MGGRVVDGSQEADGETGEAAGGWAGVNPLFGCPWGDSVIPITSLTPDLRRRALLMEQEAYPEAPAARPPPLRIQGKRGRGVSSEFLGSRWADESGGS